MSYTVSYVVSHNVGDIIINVPIIADMITAPRSPSYFSPMLVDSTYFSVAFLLLSHFCPHLLVLILFIPCYYFFLSPRISPTFPLQCPPVSSFVAILVEPEAASPRQAPLLAEPRYGSAPIAYGQYAAEGSTTPRGTGGYSDYGADTYGGGDPYRPAPQERGYGQHPPADPYSRDSYGRAPLNPPPGGNYHEQGGMGGNPASMYQQGAVLMVYGLNMEKVNCQRLFNLFCLYGNIVRIKFLKSKEGSAMIQMGDQMSCDRAIKNLNNSHMFGNVLVLSFSKQAFLQDVPNPHELPDGSLSFVDYMGTRNNRFTTPDAAQKNRVQPPAKVLHFFNAPPNITEEQVSTVFAGFELPNPSKIKMFPAKSDRSSTGLVEWENKNDSIDALSAANHMEMENPSGKRPYILKLCFSNTPIRE